MSGVYFPLSSSFIFRVSFMLIHHAYPLHARTFFTSVCGVPLASFSIFRYREDKRLFLSNAYFCKGVLFLMLFRNGEKVCERERETIQISLRFVNDRAIHELLAAEIT